MKKMLLGMTLAACVFASGEALAFTNSKTENGVTLTVEKITDVQSSVNYFSDNYAVGIENYGGRDNPNYQPPLPYRINLVTGQSEYASTRVGHFVYSGDKKGIVVNNSGEAVILIEPKVELPPSERVSYAVPALWTRNGQIEIMTDLHEKLTAEVKASIGANTLTKYQYNLAGMNERGDIVGHFTYFDDFGLGGKGFFPWVYKKNGELIILESDLPGLPFDLGAVPEVVLNNGTMAGYILNQIGPEEINFPVVWDRRGKIIKVGESFGKIHDMNDSMTAAGQGSPDNSNFNWRGMVWENSSRDMEVRTSDEEVAVYRAVDDNGNALGSKIVWGAATIRDAYYSVNTEFGTTHNITELLFENGEIPRTFVPSSFHTVGLNSEGYFNISFLESDTLRPGGNTTTAAIYKLTVTQE